MYFYSLNINNALSPVSAVVSLCAQQCCFKCALYTILNKQFRFTQKYRQCNTITTIAITHFVNNSYFKTSYVQYCDNSLTKHFELPCLRCDPHEIKDIGLTIDCVSTPSSDTVRTCRHTPIGRHAIDEISAFVIPFVKLLFVINR